MCLALPLQSSIIGLLYEISVKDWHATQVNLLFVMFWLIACSTTICVLPAAQVFLILVFQHASRHERALTF